jgi:serine/threonine protein kinase
MKDLGSHPNVINLRHYFFTHGEEEEIFLNLIMDYIPETLYRVVKYYSRRQK